MYGKILCRMISQSVNEKKWLICKYTSFTCWKQRELLQFAWGWVTYKACVKLFARKDQCIEAFHHSEHFPDSRAHGWKPVYVEK